MVKKSHIGLLVVLFTALVAILSFAAWRFIPNNRTYYVTPPVSQSHFPTFEEIPDSNLYNIPQTHIIPLQLHVFQTFNNCGPASLSMLLSYYDITVSQKNLGQKLRPYQIPNGNNDDKSVTLEELAREAQNYGLLSYHRPNGSIVLLKQFIAHDMPIIIRTWTKPGEDISHYRLIRGYDDSASQIIQDDSLQNKNLRFSYTDLESLWKPFSFEYLVIVPPEKKVIAEKIIGESLDVKKAWEIARNDLLSQLTQNPDDMTILFNLSVASYHVRDFEASISYFEQVESRLPFRMLWYQIEPIQSYFEVGQYARVFEITDKILNNNNRAFSELYLLRGEIYLKQGNREAAREEFQKAVLYNKNLQAAQDALSNIQ